MGSRSTLSHPLQVSRIFKAGNQLVFLEDLKHRLADLYHTREILQQKRTPGQQQLRKNDDDDGYGDGDGTCDDGVDDNRNEALAAFAALSSTASSIAKAERLVESAKGTTPPIQRLTINIPTKRSSNTDQDQELLNAVDDPSVPYIPPTVPPPVVLSSMLVGGAGPDLSSLQMLYSL